MTAIPAMTGLIWMYIEWGEQRTLFRAKGTQFQAIFSEVFMEEPQPTDTGDVAPSSMSHIVGQAGVKAQVAVALEAAWAD